MSRYYKKVVLVGLCEPVDNWGNHFLRASCGDGFRPAAWFDWKEK